METKADIIRVEILEKVKEYYLEKFGEIETFVPGVSSIRYAGRVFNEFELINLVDSSLDFWLTTGRYSEEFCGKLEDFFNVSNAILTNSGSSANLLAISALCSEKLYERKLNPGDEVITVAAGFPSTLSPIIQNNLLPVFIDVELGTYNVAVERLVGAISKKTKAIFLAHTVGNPFEVIQIQKIAKEYDLWFIEDNCDALGSKYDKKLTGTFGHISTISFYPAHHITTGEGGCVITDDLVLANIMKSIRDWGRDCYCDGGESNTCGIRYKQKLGNLPLGYDHKYTYSHIGYNLKMTDLQASIGSAQIDKIEYFIEKRKANFILLKKALEQFTDFLILPKATPNSDPSWFCFMITVKENKYFTRNELTYFLASRKIETRNLFAGNLLLQPAFLKIKHRIFGSLENTNYIMENSFFLGVYPGLKIEHIEYIIQSFNLFFSKKLIK